MRVIQRFSTERGDRAATAVWGRLLRAAVPLALAGLLLAPPVEAKPRHGIPGWREQIIHILGTTLNQDREPIGVVSELIITVERRNDHQGLEVTFETEPGHFSAVSQAAVLQAIITTSRVARLSTDSLSVSLAVPFRGLTVYGESLSAMVGLTVVALAKGDFVLPDRVITGTVRPDGHIGPVGGVPLKVKAAYQGHLRRVLVPEEQDVGEGDWETPFLMQVSPVSHVARAYKALTDRPLMPTDPSGLSDRHP